MLTTNNIAKEAIQTEKQNKLIYGMGEHAILKIVRDTKPTGKSRQGDRRIGGKLLKNSFV